MEAISGFHHAFLTNASGGSNTFTKPTDNIGNKTFTSPSGYETYANRIHLQRKHSGLQYAGTGIRRSTQRFIRG